MTAILRWITISLLLLAAHTATAQKIDKEVPRNIRHLVSQVDYAAILSLAIHYLDEKGTVTSVRKGVIRFSGQGTDSYEFGTSELVRACMVSSSPAQWATTVAGHFDKAFIDLSNTTDFTQFEAVAPLLVLRVYPDSYFKRNKKLRKKTLGRTDFAGTRTTLVYDFPEQFRLVQESEMEHWKVSNDSLFSLANANLKHIEIEIDEHIMPSGHHVFTFYSDDYSPAYLIDFEDNASAALGKYGALVAIPIQGAGLAIPVDDGTILNVMSELHSTMMSQYQHQPGPVSNRFFWYYNKEFVPVPFTVESGLVHYALPADLQDLIRK